MQGERSDTEKAFGLAQRSSSCFALHRNTENYHLHVVINRVDPESLRVADKGWCIDRSHKAIAEIVYLYGWEPEAKARYLANSRGDFSLSGAAYERKPKARVMDRENATGEKSSERLAVEEAGSVLANAQSWEQVHADLNRLGMCYELKGSGALVWVGDQPVKASVIGREFSKARMEERLGGFLLDTNQGRTEKTSRKPEPLRQDHPERWLEYRKLLEKHHAEKSFAQTEQRVAHREARNAQLASFRQERKALYQGARWSGVGLNVARSLMASDHAKRKAQLVEEQRIERSVVCKRFGHRPTSEQFLLASGNEQLAKAWRYQESAQVRCGLLGNGDDSARKRDIRDFTGEVQQTQGGKSLIHYSRPNGKQISFTNQGKRIDIWATGDETAVLAALQLGAQKWGDITITGSMEFKLLCAEVASKNGIKIVNPELQYGALPRGRVHTPKTEAATRTAASENSYLRHKVDIQSRLQLVNPSRLDWMIAVRMRVTGHDQQSIATALRKQAPGGRENENRDWGNYAERTAHAAFGARGDVEATRNKHRVWAWMQVEGRESAREVPTDRHSLVRSRSVAQGSVEPEM